jgi:hypothetical protein
MRVSNRECSNVGDVKGILSTKEFLYVLSTIFTQSGCNFVEMPTKIYRGIVSSLEIDATEYILYLQASVKFYPHFPHLVSDLDKIRSAHNAVHIRNFRENRRRQVHTSVK